jgi:hypothetical protein
VISSRHAWWNPSFFKMCSEAAFRGWAAVRDSGTICFTEHEILHAENLCVFRIYLILLELTLGTRVATPVRLESKRAILL